MKEKEALDALRELGVLVEGHFVLSSGWHSPFYINKDILLPRIRLTSRFCREIAGRFCGREVETVIGPIMGGAVVARSVASHLSSMDESEVMAVYAEKTARGDSSTIRPSHRQFIVGKKVLVMEDVLTLGLSAGKVVELVRKEGGEVVGVGAIFNRGGDTPKSIIGVRHFFAVININLGCWPESECQLCAEGIPVNTDIGHSQEFLVRKQRRQQRSFKRGAKP